MDKIIRKIFEEARRRPGKRLVPKLYQVLAELNGMVDDLIDHLIQAERTTKGRTYFTRQH